jgi:uncharacterized membrane protein YkvA (DUF1232 family)
VVPAMLITLGVLALGWLALIALLWLHRPTRDQAAIYLRLIPDLSRLVLRLLRDSGTPARYRLALLCLAAWLANPIDLVPDFLPVIGALDDVIIAALVLRWVGRGVGMTRIEMAWSGSDEGLALLRRVLAARDHHI